MLDIREGDLLIVGTKEYPIKSCAEWIMTRQSVSSFFRMATVPVSTKRSIQLNGKRAAATDYLNNLKATPLDPVSAELAKTVELGSPAELLQTYLTDGSGFVHLILEDVK